MDPRLKHLVDEYLGAVRTAVALLAEVGILAAFGFKSRDDLKRIFNAEVRSGRISSSGCILDYLGEAGEAGHGRHAATSRFRAG